jgi:hypothetical protein
MINGIKWGILIGIIIFILSTCVSSVIGIINNCVLPIFVIIASGISGIICGNIINEKHKILSGAISGFLIGGLGVLGQIFGSIVEIAWNYLHLSSIGEEYNNNQVATVFGLTTGILLNATTTLICAIITIISGAVIGGVSALIIAKRKK